MTTIYRQQRGAGARPPDPEKETAARVSTGAATQSSYNIKHPKDTAPLARIQALAQRTLAAAQNRAFGLTFVVQMLAAAVVGLLSAIGGVT